MFPLNHGVMAAGSEGIPVTGGRIAHYSSLILSGYVDGDDVSLWPDVSGSGFHLNGLAAYNTSHPSGIPLLLFSGNGFSNTQFPALGAQNRTVFVVGTSSQTSDNVVVAMGRGSGGANGENYKVTSEMALRVNGGNRFWPPPFTGTSGPIKLVTIRQSGSNTADTEAWLDGASLTETSTIGAELSTASGLGVGAQTGTLPFSGNLGEVIIFNRALSTSEREQVDNYLIQRFQISGDTP
tara:strand:+ start:310 stop:1023 length:714 start_codon:yes stop_codon:yes gene_type:complete